MLLALLDRTQMEPAVRDHSAAYLAGHRDSPKPLDRLLARAALDGRPAAADLLDVELFLRQAPDFTGARKRALLHAVLVLLGATPDTARPGAEAFDLRGLHAWARVQVTTAVKAVLAHAHRQPHQIDARGLELLRSTQRPATVWEGNLLIHLSVLHALAPLPGNQRLITEGIRTALKYQRPDGGMPFICDEDTWLTTTAGLALHATGAPGPVLDAIAERLLRLQLPCGGWSYTEHAQLADVDCTSVAVEVLHVSGPKIHRAAISRAIHRLRPHHPQLPHRHARPRCPRRRLPPHPPTNRRVHRQHLGLHRATPVRLHRPCPRRHLRPPRPRTPHAPPGTPGAARIVTAAIGHDDPSSRRAGDQPSIAPMTAALGPLAYVVPKGGRRARTRAPYAHGPDHARHGPDATRTRLDVRRRPHAPHLMRRGTERGNRQGRGWRHPGEEKG